MSKRIVHMHIRLTVAEKELLMQKAKDTKLTVASYLRNLALNYTVTSKVDREAGHQLTQARGDLGRLGGLFKMWLVENKDSKGNKIGAKSYSDIDKLVDELWEEEQKIMKAIEKVMEVVK